MRPGPLGVNFSFANPSGQGVEGSSYTADWQGQDRPFTFGGSPAAGGGAGWNIEAGWHLPHTPAPSSASVEMMLGHSRSRSSYLPAQTATQPELVERNEVRLLVDVFSATEIPIVSQIAGVGAGLWYALDGDWLGAGLSVAGTIPIAGGAADATRIARAASEVIPSTGGAIRRFEQQGDRIYYRVYSGDATRGAWLTARPPKSSDWAREALALPPWNSAAFVQEVKVPHGTLLERSRATPVPEWGRKRGGAEQFKLLEAIPDSNFGSGKILP
jgi:hypothetical protein